MNKILTIALAVFLVGNILDLITTFYGFNIGLVESHEFSLILKISLVFPVAVIFFNYLFPKYKEKMLSLFLLTYGSVFLYMGLNNLILIGG